MKLLSGTLVFNEKNEILLLFKKKHKHYELPGGTVEKSACKDLNNPSIDEMKKEAERELYEEVGKDIKVSELLFFDNFTFIIPDGRKAFLYVFKTKLISGKPKLNEPDVFGEIGFFSIENLKDLPIAPNIKILIEKNNL